MGGGSILLYCMMTGSAFYRAVRNGQCLVGCGVCGGGIDSSLLHEDWAVRNGQCLVVWGGSILLYFMTTGSSVYRAVSNGQCLVGCGVYELGGGGRDSSPQTRGLSTAQLLFTKMCKDWMMLGNVWG